MSEQMVAQTSAARIFGALGDQVRLEMVRRLASESGTISAVSQNLGISRQAARKHIKVLSDANLVSLAPRGRETIITLEKQTVADAQRFIREIEAKWDLRLAALKAHVEADPTDS
jgi:DNA-binding transcriptional ArsR family regulator